MWALSLIFAGVLLASPEDSLTVVALPADADGALAELSHELPRVKDAAAARALGRKRGASRVCFLRVEPGVWLSLAELWVLDVGTGARLEDRREQFAAEEAPEVLDRLLAHCAAPSAFGLRDPGPRRPRSAPRAPVIVPAREAPPETEPWRISSGYARDEAPRWALALGLLSSWSVRRDIDAGEAGRSKLSYAGGPNQGLQLRAAYSGGIGLNLFGGLSYQARAFTSTLRGRQSERFTAHNFRSWARGGYGVTLARRVFVVPRLGLSLDARAVPVLQGATLESFATLQAELGIGIAWRGDRWETSAGVDGGWILWLREGAPGSGEDPRGWTLAAQVSLTHWFSGSLGVGLGAEYRLRSVRFSGVPPRPMPMDERDTASDLRLRDQALASVLSLKLKL